jgi:hypothetical protein
MILSELYFCDFYDGQEGVRQETQSEIVPVRRRGTSALGTK